MKAKGVRKMIEKQVQEEAFRFIKPEDKSLIVAFTKSLEDGDYTYGDSIGSGFCWGK